MAVLEEVIGEVTSETRPKSGMVGGVSRGAVGRRRKKKPASILDEVTEEVSKEPVPEGALAQVMRETETDPETVRRMRAEGQPLTTDQQRIAFEAERARPLTDVALGAAGAFIQAVPETVGQLVRGTGKFAYEGALKPIGQTVLAGLQYEPGSDEYERALSQTYGGANRAVRSLASGVAQDMEETANAATRAAMFGTSITDRAAEKLGLVTPEQSFNNYLAREDMRRGEAEDIQENPDRAATLLARNPLAGTVIEGAAMLSGQGALTPEAKRAALAGYEESLLQEAKFRPDEDISMLGEVLSPVGLPARLVKPVTSALGGTMEAAGGLAVRGVTKPTIRGVNPLEGVGIGIRRVGEGAEKVGAGISQAITGRPDTFLAAPGTIVSAFTKRPGQLVEGVGRTLRDVGRQIDEGGIRGRTGIVERLGRDPQSADWIRDLFGPGAQKRLEKMERKNKQRVAEGKEPIRPGRGGVMRARTADYGLRLANSLTKSGVSGAALNGIIGAADIETAEEFGRSTGVGFGIGSYMAGRVPERIGAALDPTTGLATKIDRVTEIDPLDRRLDEDADLKRFRATADPELVRQVEKLSSPEEQVASRMRELDELFQRKAEADYAEEDTAELDAVITQKADELSALQESTKDLTQEDRDERRRAVELIMADGLDLLKSNGRAAGLNGVNVKILDPSQIESFIRERWGQNLEQAEAIVTQLGGRTDLSPSEEQSLLRANQAVQKFQEQVQLWPQQTGFALSDSDQADAPAHLRMANIGAPTIVMNTEQLMRDPRRVGLRYLLQHESNHILEQFREVQEMQRPVRDLWFGKRIVRPDGTVLEATPGIITDDWINDVGIPMYAERLYGPGGETKFRDSFASPQQAVEYVRSELMSELSALSETGYSTIREALDSPGQAVVDRLLISRKNSMLGRLRQALEAMGVELDSKGDVKSVIFGDQAPFDPDALAIMRQYKRNLREFNDMLTYAGGTTEGEVEISVTELMTNRALQEAYKDDVIWDKETVLDVQDDEGNTVAQIVIPDDPTTDSATGEYRIVNGRLVDENGNALPLTPTIDLSGLPDGSRASIDSRIARNPDGSPKILTNKEIQARARQRDQMIKDAIDNAPEDGFEGRLRDTGNGSYRGVMSPSQLEAVMALPNSVIPPSLKKNIAAFNEVLQKRDGTRILMEYQAALRGGRYRALSPRIRDVVPIGYQFSKQGNFLATTISVSRMFDKMNLWSQKRPENLNLWGRDLGKFWEDVTRVLDNHNRGLAGQTGLDVDPDIAMQKKNRINDFFNLFTKETESLNPSRTTLPARRGKDSADRLIMSARMDRINQMQISNAQKLPVDYGKMLVNFFPENEARSLRLDQFQDAPVENDIVGGAMPRFLPGIRYTSLPDDPKKTMADFYMLNAMITTPPTGWSMGKFGGEATMYAPSADPTGRYAGVRAEKYQDALDEAKQTLIPSLHSKIQKALHFAIAAELRHAIPRRQPADLAETEFYQEYMRQYAIQGAGMPDLKKEKGPRRYKGESEGYRASFVAMENARKKLGMGIADVARFAEQLYRRGDWSSSYGGNPWGDIAAHLAQMSDPTYSTERVRAVATDPETGRMQIIETNEFRDPGAYNAMFQEIDRAYDLQHNTNTVFNKLKKYYLGVEGYGWIAKMLDFKANVANPRELRGFVSGTMGKLADAWFADMRADAPLTQDLEAKVIEQLPPTLVENMDPSQFTDLLKDLVSDYYRKSSSGVRREAPFENIANAAEGIFRKNGGKNDDWKAIKKDQNAHIGIILDDHFGDLGVARTDAVKLFRMLLVEGRDPRVTGKTPSLPTKMETGLSEKSSSSGVLKATKNMVNMAASSKVVGDGFGEGEWTVKLVSKNSELNTLTLYKNGKPVNSYSIAMTTKGKPMVGSIELATEMINKDIAKSALNAPSAAKTSSWSDQWFIGNVFQPKLDKSTPSNLNEFVTGLLFNGFNGLKLGDVTVVNAGGSGQAATLKVYQGDSVSEGNLLTTATIPGGKKRDIVDWLAEYALMRAKMNGYGNTADWMQQNLKAEMKPQMPAPSQKVSDLIAVLPVSAKARVNQLIKNLQDLEWVDVNLANLPPSDIDASAEYVETLLLSGAGAPAKAMITDSIGAGDVEALGKYLYDVGKWASDKLEKRKAADMIEEVEEEGLTLDSPAVGYAKADDTLMTVAEAAAMVGPFEEGEIGGTNHVYFTANSGTAVTNPYEDEQGDPFVTEWAPGNKTAIMQYWADNGVLPSVSETALAIFDAANPSHPYLKPSENEADPVILADSDALMKFVDNLGVTLDDAQATKDGKWKSVVLTNGQGDEVKIVKQVAEDGMYQFIKDDKNFAIGPFAYVIREAAKYLNQKSPEKKDETAAQKQAMEFLNDALLDEPTTIDGNTWELEGIEDDSGEITAAVVKLNGVAVSNTIPFEPETATPMTGPKGIYDDYFALDWMKDWKTPEAQSLLTPEQDFAMQAAAQLMDPDIEVVEIGGKKFAKGVTQSGSVAISAYNKDNEVLGIIPIQGSQNMEPMDLEAAIYEALSTLGATSAPASKTKSITTQMINEAAEALMNDETTSLGKYTFEPIASGLGGTRVNIYVEPGMEDSVGYFMLDPGEYREPSDMLDAFYDKISEFLENNPPDKGGGGTGPGAKFMPVNRSELSEENQKIFDAFQERVKKGFIVSHGTTRKNAKKILSQGFKGNTYFALDPDFDGGWDVDDKNTFHISVDTSKLDPKRMFPDPEQAGIYHYRTTKSKDWNKVFDYIRSQMSQASSDEDSIFGDGNFVYTGKIPSLAIKAVWDWDTDDKFDTSGVKFMPASRASLVDRIVKDANARVEDRLKGESAWLSPRGWVNVDDHLDIFPEDLFDLRRVNYDDLKDRRFVRVRRMGRTLWYEGRPTPKMLKELKDTAIEKKLKLEEDRIEPYGSSARFMPAGFYDPDEDVPSLRQKAWITPDGEIVNVDPGSEHRIAARSFYPNVESDEKAQMAAENEGYLRVVRQGSRVNIGGRTPNSSQRDTLTRLRLDHDYEIQDDRGRSMAARFMPAGPSGSSQDDQSLAGVAAPVSDQAPLSGARFMPGYNPRYTDDDGNFDYGLYSEDRRKTIAYLRDRMGITRKDFPNEEEWKRAIRETMRDVIRGG